MRAKAKAIILAATLWVGVPLAAMAAPDEMADRCAFLSSVDADKLHTALTGYVGKVMGKYPEHWSAVDYANLAANAASCNGLPLNVQNKVNAELWALKLADAQKMNAEINARSNAIAVAYGKYWTTSEEFPACAAFLKWERDDVWYTNNSEKLFGTAFYNMTPEMLGLYKRLAQECLPVMKSILDRWHAQQSEADGIVKSIVASIDMDGLAAQEKISEIPKSLQLDARGQRIPIAYLRPTTQKVVKKIIALENADRIMPTNSLIQISKWAEQVEIEETDGPDLLYAQRVKSIVADHLFRAADAIRKPRAGPNSGG
ncbi:hypothetical protein HFO56_01180 [Rhizobium laguerreae]|uniref:hypothetical protein n=1 Tax=Rhizobium laguerreae TaxID=1076926 RepID=UPI001C927D0E|nr:hypothetical protein [Rhizobium laguerreae]MBY3151040.1 hypothetical protein [Rhizobium laguerreae]MBY3433230.1 hypothetical protein [Rhizobium laguerreae]